MRYPGFLATAQQPHEKTTETVEGQIRKQGRIFGKDTVVFPRRNNRRTHYPYQNSQLGRNAQDNHVIVGSPERVGTGPWS